MTSFSDLWPPSGLTLRSDDLTLSAISDEDLPSLVDLALSGVHEPDVMPFDVPWTQTPPEELPRRFAQHYWELRAGFSPERFTVEFAVRRAGDVVGVQGFHTTDFTVTRTAETGSWLAQRYHGQGIGTRMRRMVCTLLFDHLDATQVTSGAFTDNLASLAVSRKVGYRPDGVIRKNRLGRLALNQRLVLEPDHFVRGGPVDVAGVEPLRRFVGLP
jgi:RimJ/RimL family protein N-acetyltransferase